MKIKFFNFLSSLSLGTLSTGTVTPIVVSNCRQASIPIDSIQLDKKEFELSIGQKDQLTVKFVPENATNKKVTWSFSDNSIATVDQTGLVTAVGVGTTTVTVTTQDGSKTAKCEINVIEKTVPVDSIQLNKSEWELVVGGNEQLKATVLPENATNKKVTWKSSDEKIATVNQTGLVTAVSVGTATVTVTTEDGDKTATCQVTVIAKTVPVESVKLDKIELELTVSQAHQFIAIVEPEGATNKKISWKSSDENIATVDQTGLVTAVSVGTTTVTVTTQDGGKTATCLVNIIAKSVPVENIQLDKNKLEINAGGIGQLTIKFVPENASNKKVTWKSNNVRVATVDQRGLVTAVAEGIATITVVTDDGGKTATCLVNIVAKPIPVESVELNKSMLTLVKGETEQLTATILPKDATNKDATWSSNNESVATVDQTGLVKAISFGNTTITVTTKDGGKTATCKIIVDSIHVKSVQLNKKELTLAEGEIDHLIVTVLPEDAANKNVTWKSSDEKVATVDQNGKVIAVIAGTAIITVTTEDGGKTATCQVTVKLIPVESVQLDKSKIELTAGSTEQLTATVLPENASYKKVIWTSSDETVATVDQSGTVKAIVIGNVTIIATTADGGHTATCKVTVKPTPVEGVQLDKNELELAVGSTYQLTATVLPEFATNKNVTWSSKNESVATVSNKGLVTAIKLNWNTIIAVITEDGGFTATCRVIVRPVPVESIQLDKDELDLAVGDIGQLTATVLPENASNKNITWSSNDESIATVNQTGLVTAVGTGITNITVTTEDGGKTATCEIFTFVIPVENVKLSSDKLDLVEGETKQLTATILPKNAANKKVTWKSSDEEIAKVDQKGLVSAVAEGIATIIVVTDDGGKTATCLVNIIAKPVPVKSVQLNMSELEIISGEYKQLTATVLPENATNKNVTWKSSDPSIATVDDNGQVSAVATGNTTITVTTEDGGKTATCKVAVNLIHVESVQLNKSKFELVGGKSEQLIATVLPEDATNKKVTWSSSDEKVATVDQTGLVCAVRMGNTTITVTTEDGGKTATCMVSVPFIHVESVQLDKDKLELVIGSTYHLKATVIPENATNKTVFWLIDDESIATVEQDGLVTAINKGIANIVVTTTDGGKTATCQVTVKPAAVEGVQLSNSEFELYINQSGMLSATVLPENATNKKVTWSSKDPSIVEFISTDHPICFITGLKLGHTIVTVTTEDGGKTATCRVTIKPIPVEKVQLDRREIELIDGQKAQLTATVLPENATIKNIIWTTNDNLIATVDKNGTVTAIYPGTATITATAEIGGKTATCKVIVTPVDVESVQLDKNKLELAVGQDSQLKVTVLPENASYKKVTWISSDKNIATVNEDGIVYAVRVGKAIITVTTQDGSKTAACEIDVTKFVSVENIQLSKYEISLVQGYKEQLTATIYPADATNKNVTWSSNDESIATVDENGLVKAIRHYGTAIITATTKDGGKIAICMVTVIPDIHVRSIKFDKPELDLAIGYSKKLTVTIEPSSAANKKVTWSSNDKTIVTVDKNGLVTPVGEGTTIVTVTTQDGGKTATCNVKVGQLIPVEKIQLNKWTLTLAESESEQLIATVLPENASNQKINWYSGYNSVATVDQNGLVHAKRDGHTTIFAVAEDGGYKISCSCTVKKLIFVEDVQFDTSEFNVIKNRTKQLTATVLPENASNKKVTWSSDDEDIAIINKDGLVTGVNIGKTTITVTTLDGGKTATCKVIVNPVPVDSVLLDKNILELDLNTPRQLVATILPEDAANKNVTWSSNDPSVAAVDQNGLVTLISDASTFIVVTTEDGGKTATCKVSIFIHAEKVELNETDICLKSGDILSLTPTIYPLDASDKSVVWKSSHEDVATIDNNGNVKCLKAGYTVITVTTNDRGLEATCNIVVDFGSDLLCVIANEDMRFWVRQNEAQPGDFKFSTDGQNWILNENQVINLKKGEALYVKGDNPNGLSRSVEKYWNIKCYDGNASILGNIMGLLDDGAKDGEPGDMTQIPRDYCFFQLFVGQISRVDKKLLSKVKTLTTGCFQQMFFYCQTLIQRPELPDVEQAPDCYKNIFGW